MTCNEGLNTLTGKLAKKKDYPAPMTPESCIEILTEHNKWRRADTPYDSPYQKYPHSAKLLGEAIDYAIRRIEMSDALWHACNSTLMEHAYLSDGDVCTLAAIKKAMREQS